MTEFAHGILQVLAHKGIKRAGPARVAYRIAYHASTSRSPARKMLMPECQETTVEFGFHVPVYEMKVTKKPPSMAVACTISAGFKSSLRCRQGKLSAEARLQN